MELITCDMQRPAVMPMAAYVRTVGTAWPTTLFTSVLDGNVAAKPPVTNHRRRPTGTLTRHLGRLST